MTRLSEVDNLRWDLENNFTFARNKEVTQHIKDHIQEQITRENVDCNTYAGYISRKALHEKIRAKFNRDKMEYNLTPTEKVRRARIASLKARRLSVNII